MEQHDTDLLTFQVDMQSGELSSGEKSRGMSKAFWQIVRLDRKRIEHAFKKAKHELKDIENKMGINHPDVCPYLHKLAALYKKVDDHYRSEKLYLRSLEILEKAHGSESSELVYPMLRLSHIYRLDDILEPAEKLLWEALAIEEKNKGVTHPDTADILNRLAQVTGRQRNHEQAELLYKRALVILEEALGKDDLEVGYLLNNLGFFYYYKCKYSEAIPIFERALAIFKNSPEDESDWTSTIVNALDSIKRTCKDNATEEYYVEEECGIHFLL